MFGKLSNILYSFFLVFITAVVAKYFTVQGMSAFYEVLDIPVVTPENHYFSYIWRGLYFLLFLSFCLILESSIDREQLLDAKLLFVCQLFMQILWTFSFFYLEQLFASVIVIILLDVVVALMMHSFFFISKWAFALTVPYLVWLLFATYLNIAILFLNF